MADIEKIIAVEAGGCAPPVLTPLQQREMDRAHVDAGIMPLAEYIRMYGRDGQATVADGTLVASA